MIVEIVGGADERPKVQVMDVDDLTRLHLAVGEATDDEADAVLREAGLGRLESHDVGVLDTAALRAAAQARATAEDWSAGFDGMVEHAREKGWLTDDGTALQVHVESAAGA